MCAFYSIQLSHLFSRAIKPSHLSAMPCLVICSSEERARSSPEVLSKYIGHVLHLLFTQFVWKQMKWPCEVQEPWSSKQGVHPFALSKALKGFCLHRWLIQQKGQIDAETGAKENQVEWLTVIPRCKTDLELNDLWKKPIFFLWPSILQAPRKINTHYYPIALNVFYKARIYSKPKL